LGVNWQGFSTEEQGLLISKIGSKDRGFVGAAEGCDLLIFVFQDQKIAAFGSSYRGIVF
jgi:hypothetical protein